MRYGCDMLVASLIPTDIIVCHTHHQPQLTKKAKATAAAVKEPVAAVVAQPTATSSSPSADGTGPRSAGARRSAERSRGKRKSPPSGGDDN